MWTHEEVRAHIDANPTRIGGVYYDGRYNRPWRFAIRNGMHVATPSFHTEEEADAAHAIAEEERK